MCKVTPVYGNWFYYNMLLWFVIMYIVVIYDSDNCLIKLLESTRITLILSCSLWNHRSFILPKIGLQEKVKFPWSWQMGRLLLLFKYRLHSFGKPNF